MLEMISLNDELLKVQDQYEELLVSREHFLKFGSSARTQQRTTSVPTFAPTSTTPSNSADLLDLTGDLEKMKFSAMQGGGLADFDTFFATPTSAPPATTASYTTPYNAPYATTNTTTTAPYATTNTATYNAPVSAYNPFNSPGQAIPPQTAPVSAPTSNNAFDEFDMLATRHTTQQPILTPLASMGSNSTSYQQTPTTASGFGAPVLTPLKSNNPLPPISSNTNISNAYQSTSPVNTNNYLSTSPVRQQGGFPNYTTTTTTAYPQYGAPVQPMMGYSQQQSQQQPHLQQQPQPQPQAMGGKPLAFGVPYGSYNQQVPYYQQQGAMYPNYQPPKTN
jgi:hypothetical protein